MPKYNELGQRLVTHHIKYLEIHGVDEVVEITESEHKLLHNRLRREGKCNIPADELGKISIKASYRAHKEEITARAIKHHQDHKEEYRRRRLAREALMTPEQKDARRVKRVEARYRREALMTPEQKEDKRQMKNLRNKRYRAKKKLENSGGER